MADIPQWMRAVPNTHSVSPTTETQDGSRRSDSRTRSNPTQASSSKARRPPTLKLSSFLSSRRSSVSPKRTGFQQEVAFPQRDDVYNPDPDQMADTLLTAAMARVGQPMPAEYTSLLLHVLEAYANLRKSEEEVKVKHREEYHYRQIDLENFENQRELWLAERESYKVEIKRLEVIIAEGKHGMKSLATARSGSLLSREERRKTSREASHDWGKDTKGKSVLESEGTAPHRTQPDPSTQAFGLKPRFPPIIPSADPQLLVRPSGSKAASPTEIHTTQLGRTERHGTRLKGTSLISKRLQIQRSNNNSPTTTPTVDESAVRASSDAGTNTSGTSDVPEYFTSVAGNLSESSSDDLKCPSTQRDITEEPHYVSPSPARSLVIPRIARKSITSSDSPKDAAVENIAQVRSTLPSLHPQTQTKKFPTDKKTRGRTRSSETLGHTQGRLQRGFSFKQGDDASADIDLPFLASQQPGYNLDEVTTKIDKIHEHLAKAEPDAAPPSFAPPLPNSSIAGPEKSQEEERSDSNIILPKRIGSSKIAQTRSSQAKRVFRSHQKRGSSSSSVITVKRCSEANDDNNNSNPNEGSSRSGSGKKRIVTDPSTIAAARAFSAHAAESSPMATMRRSKGSKG
ncbi:MAG: hypothetical protein M1837_002843 [Sclerophora amabilis]|nr:MAG: hypothetical protein M1837_002843 [Sclerophora amabilis]